MYKVLTGEGIQLEGMFIGTNEDELWNHFGKRYQVKGLQ